MSVFVFLWEAPRNFLSEAEHWNEAETWHQSVSELPGPSELLKMSAIQDAPRQKSEQHVEELTYDDSA